MRLTDLGAPPESTLARSGQLLLVARAGSSSFARSRTILHLHPHPYQDLFLHISPCFSYASLFEYKRAPVDIHRRDVLYVGSAVGTGSCIVTSIAASLKWEAALLLQLLLRCRWLLLRQFGQDRPALQAHQVSQLVAPCWLELLGKTRGGHLGRLLKGS